MKKYFLTIIVLLLISACSTNTQLEYNKAKQALNNNNYIQGIPQMKIAAIKGNLKAQIELADMLTYMPTSLIIKSIIDFENQKQEAAKWYKKAADQGDKYALFQYALILKDEDYIGWDLAESLSILNSQAIDNYLPAQIILYRYYDQVGNTSNAVKWLKQAVLNDDPVALFSMAMRYKFGEFVKKDTNKYLQYLKRSAQLNSPDAQYYLSNLYAFGEDLPKDEKKSLEWALKSAKQGFPAAQYNTAIKYHDGLGTTQDLEKSLYWFQKALASGIEQARQPLSILIRQGVPITLTVP